MTGSRVAGAPPASLEDLRPMAAIPPPPGAGADERRGPRAAWVDDLRVAIITGVIGAHVSLTYALDVGWHYEERTASEVGTALLAGVFSPGLVFGLGLRFFVAGRSLPAPSPARASAAS